MIETTHKSIHLVPYQKTNGRIKDISKAPVVTVSKKYSCIIFSKKCVKLLNMEGQFIRLFYEPTKKIIAWKLDVKFRGDDSSGWKLVKVHGVTGTARFGIGSMLREFNLDKDSYTNLEVKKNVVNQGLLEKGDSYFYVEVK